MSQGKEIIIIEKSHSRLLAAILSLICPGLGQLYKGQLFNALAWFICVGIGYIFIIPGILLHFLCILGAASGKSEEAVIKRTVSNAKETSTGGQDRLFFEKINNSFTLLQRGLITKEEFQNTKDSAINNLPSRYTGIDKEAFLTMLLPLLDSGALSLTDIEKIKERF